MIFAVSAGKNAPDSHILSRSFIIQQKLDRDVKYLRKSANFIICDEACSFFDAVHGITAYDNTCKLQVLGQSVLGPMILAAQLPNTLTTDILSAIVVIYLQLSHLFLCESSAFYLTLAYNLQIIVLKISIHKILIDKGEALLVW